VIPQDHVHPAPSSHVRARAHVREHFRVLLLRDCARGCNRDRVGEADSLLYVKLIQSQPANLIFEVGMPELLY
jgi:hypothetical protein